MTKSVTFNNQVFYHPLVSSGEESSDPECTLPNYIKNLSAQNITPKKLKEIKKRYTYHRSLIESKKHVDPKTTENLKKIDTLIKEKEINFQKGKIKKYAKRLNVFTFIEPKKIYKTKNKYLKIRASLEANESIDKNTEKNFQIIDYALTRLELEHQGDKIKKYIDEINSYSQIAARRFNKIKINYSVIKENLKSLPKIPPELKKDLYTLEKLIENIEHPHNLNNHSVDILGDTQQLINELSNKDSVESKSLNQFKEGFNTILSNYNSCKTNNIPVNNSLIELKLSQLEKLIKEKEHFSPELDRINGFIQELHPSNTIDSKRLTQIKESCESYRKDFVDNDTLSDEVRKVYLYKLGGLSQRIKEIESVKMGDYSLIEEYNPNNV